LNIPIAIYVLSMGWKIIPNNKNIQINSFDWKGILFLSLFVTSIALSLTMVDEKDVLWSILNIKVLSLVFIAALSLLIFIFIEKKASSPIIKLSLFNIKQIRLIMGLGFGLGVVQSSFVFLPDMAMHQFNLSVAKAGMMLFPALIAIALGSPVTGKLLDKIGPKPVVILGLILSGIGLFLFGFELSNAWLFYVAGFIFGLGLSMLVGPTLRYIMMNEVDISYRTVSQGLLTMVMSIGQIVGSSFIGTLSNHGYGITFYVLSFLSILLLLLAFRLHNIYGKRIVDEA